MENELHEIFERIKKTLYEKDYNKLDLPELVELILKENKTANDIKNLKLIYEYIIRMERSLENLGTITTKIDELNKDSTTTSDIELQVRNLIEIVDQYIDSSSAILRVVDFKESKLILKQSLAYLKATRYLIISKTNEYKLKINKNTLDKKVFLKFLIDIIDTFVREAYITRILKIKQVLEKTIDVTND